MFQKTQAVYDNIYLPIKQWAETQSKPQTLQSKKRHWRKENRFFALALFSGIKMLLNAKKFDILRAYRFNGFIESSEVHFSLCVYGLFTC